MEAKWRDSPNGFGENTGRERVMIINYKCKCGWVESTRDLILVCSDCASNEIEQIFEGEENEKLVERVDTNDTSGNSSRDNGDNISEICRDDVNAF